MRTAANEVVVRYVNVPSYDRDISARKEETLFCLVQDINQHPVAKELFDDPEDRFAYVTERNKRFRNSFVYSDEVIPPEVIEAIRKDLATHNRSSKNHKVTILVPR